MYNHKKIENKWQEYWSKNNTFKTTNNSDKKYYALDMFPYPSGTGLHVGHPEGYTATDIISRYKRFQGFDVLHPIGWDAFGLPAEQYAIQTGNHPAEFTEKNIDNFRRQIKALGFSFDYLKEVNTTEPSYYKLTQWIFLKLYDANLAELKDVEVNWCEGLGTVLANEEVLDDEDGNKVSERGSFPVIKKPMKQWVLKITEYADQLFDDLSMVDYPSSLVSLQKNWIRNEDGTLHLRDWVFSRQRYWGEPFPIVHNIKDGSILPIRELPVVLPEMDEIKPSGTGESPLANNKEWLYYSINGVDYRRETNTMPQWAGSSWYYLAYILKNEDGTYLDIESKEAKTRFKKWLPVDLYIGGQEHAVLHLLYARFWHKVLYDAGIVPTKEPFQKIVNQGMILGPDGSKMSKSKGNVINPDDIIDEFGADTLRVYEMFMGPLEDTKPWSTNAISGIYKWLNRVFRMYTIAIDPDDDAIIIDETLETCPLSSEYNKLVITMTSDIEQLKFNTSISKMMVFINSVFKIKKIKSIDILKSFAIMLSVFAPHISEELFSFVSDEPLENQTWPHGDEKLISVQSRDVAIQVNGKLRGTIAINDDMSNEEILSIAKSVDAVKKHISGKVIVKEIYVPNKIINFVLK